MALELMWTHVELGVTINMVKWKGKYVKLRKHLIKVLTKYAYQSYSGKLWQRKRQTVLITFPLEQEVPEIST